MKRLVVVAVLAGLAGCVSGAAIAKPQRVSLPLLIGATVADLVVTTVLASQIQNYSIGGSLATAAAVTAADVGIGCVLGACSSLRP
jgi:hypothetical protein